MIQDLIFYVFSLTISSLSIPFVLVILITALRYYLQRHVREPGILDAPRVGKDPRRGWFWSWKSWKDLQQGRQDFVKDGKALTRRGYDLYKDSMYWIQTGDMERLVVSGRYIDELRRYPASVLDSRAAVVERNLGWYNGVDLILKTTLHVDVCRTQLVQNLGQVVLDQVEVLPCILKRFIGDATGDAINDYDDVTYYNAAETMLHVVNRCVARTLVGPRLCSSEEWLNACEDTTVNTGLLCKHLQQYQPFLRPLVNRFFSPSRNRLDRSYRTAERLLEGEIQTRRREANGGDVRADILQWLMDAKKRQDTTKEKTKTSTISRQRCQEQELDISLHTRQILFVTTAATRSTATAIVHVLFDLAARPRCQDILLREIIDQLAQSGGAWDLAALDRMHRLDSFIKESQRLNPHLLLSFNRKVKQPISLPVLAGPSTDSGLSSENVTIPAGTFISTPAYWSARDPAVFSPALTGQPTRKKSDMQAAGNREQQRKEEGPDQGASGRNNDNENNDGEFQPWRWYHKRREAEAAAADKQHPKDHHNPSITPYLSSTPSPDNLYWGYGRNACPGRFLAAADIKLLVGWMLYHYEICFPPDPCPDSGSESDLVGSTESEAEKKTRTRKHSTRRPENVFVDERIMPCPRQLIGFVPRPVIGISNQRPEGLVLIRGSEEKLGIYRDRNHGQDGAQGDEGDQR